ncbi:type IV secretion system protein, partial [Porphyromonas loveana]|uniref:type IV secretion system protein n=1 Tax=Porphyromonas loveana TaxID=1884669 RepID=UPI00359F84F2
MLKKVVLCVFLLGIFANVAFGAGVAQPDGVIDKTVRAYEEEFALYTDIVHKAAMGLFASLFLCQFVWSVLQLFLQESLTFAAVITTVIRQVMTGAFFWWLLFDRSILETIVASFKGLSGLDLELARLVKISVNKCSIIVSSTSLATGVLEGLYIGLVGIVTAVIVAFALATATGYLAIVMLENYIVGSLGLILLGFGGSEYTRNYALSYIKTLVHIGFKLFLVSVILIIGIGIFSDITQDMVLALGNGVDVNNTSLLQSCTNLITVAFFFVVIIKVIPQISDTLIAGVSMGIGQGGAAIRSGVGGAAALAGGLVMGAGRASVGLAGTAASATGAAANAYHSSRQSGGGVGRSVGSALGSTIGHSIFGVGATAQNVFRGVRNNLADHGILRGHGPQADTIGAVQRQGSDVWSKHKELRAVDEMKQQSSISAPGTTAMAQAQAPSRESVSMATKATSQTQANSSTQESSRAFISSASGSSRDAHVSNSHGDTLRAPTAEELSKRLGVGGD